MQTTKLTDYRDIFHYITALHVHENGGISPPSFHLLDVQRHGGGDQAGSRAEQLQNRGGINRPLVSYTPYKSRDILIF